MSTFFDTSYKLFLDLQDAKNIINHNWMRQTLRNNSLCNRVYNKVCDRNRKRAGFFHLLKKTMACSLLPSIGLLVRLSSLILVNRVLANDTELWQLRCCRFAMFQIVFIAAEFNLYLCVCVCVCWSHKNPYLCGPTITHCCSVLMNSYPCTGSVSSNLKSDFPSLYRLLISI